MRSAYKNYQTTYHLWILGRVVYLLLKFTIINIIFICHTVNNNKK